MGSSRTLLCRRGDPAGVDLCVNGSSHSIPRLSPHPEKRRWVHSYGEVHWAQQNMGATCTAPCTDRRGLGVRS